MAAGIATLRRLESSDEGTFGRFAMGALSFWSGELPERGNEASYGRIPAGSYRVSLTWSPHFGRLMYLVEDVPARSGIRLHPATLMGDSRKGYRCQLNGCIALGEQRGWADGQKAILVSRPALRRLEEYLGGRSFQLEIVDF